MVNDIEVALMMKNMILVVIGFGLYLRPFSCDRGDQQSSRPSYQTLEQQGKYSLRQYPPMVIAQCQFQGHVTWRFVQDLNC